MQPMSGAKHLSPTFRRGFTVVELLVIAPIVILTIGAFITVIVNMTGEVLATRTSSVLAYDIQDSLGRIEQDIKLSTTFLEASNITLTSPQGYDNGTVGFSNVDVTKGNMLILNTLATTGNPLISTSGLIYLTNQPNACASAQVSQNKPMTMNIIYFVTGGTTTNDGTLWRRTLAQSDYLTAGCNAPWQQPSCAPGQSITGFCKTQDVRLVDNIRLSDFVVQYFTTADGSTPNSVASDTSATAAARASALQSATTVGVSINVSKTAAGRDIAQSGSLRATKLDTNASTIAAVVNVTTPAAPTVTASLTSPASAVFSWPTVPGATGYTFKYNTTGGSCSSGSWTTAFSNQNTTTYTVTGAHNSTVYGCASASNTTTSAWGTQVSLTIPLWTTPLMQNNWYDYGGVWTTPGYTKTSDGLIVLKGMIKRSGTFVSGETLFTLPVGYRPAYNMAFAVASADISATLTVNSDGTVVASSNISAAWVSLNTVAFQPSSFSSWTNMTMINGYSNRGLAGDPPFSWATDTAQRVQVQGALTPGTQTDGTIINSAPLAAANRVPLYQHIGIRSGGNGYNLIGVGADGYFSAKGGSAGSAYFTNFMYLPTSYSGTWTTMTLNNGWVAYSASYSTLQYTKTSDGMVTLRGLIRSGTTTAGTLIAVLPAGFRPAKGILIDSTCAAVFCRLDISNIGAITASTGVSAAYTSFDGITFLAEQ